MFVVLDDFSDLEETLDRYAQEPQNENYLNFYDQTDDIKDDYENDVVTGIKYPSGKIISDRELYTTNYILQDDILYEKVGKKKEPKRTKRACAMTVIPNMPAKDIYKTYRSYATRCYGATYDAEHKAYGYMTNHEARWDWYSIGGRFSGRLLVKKSVTDVLEAYKSDDKQYTPKGYKWVDGARKCDIEWDMMNRLRVANVFREYAKYSKMFLTGEVPKDSYIEIDYIKGCIKQYWELIYEKTDTIETFCERSRLFKDIHYYVSCRNIVDDDWSTNRSNNYKWAKEIDNTISNADDTSYLVIVDCHM